MGSANPAVGENTGGDLRNAAFLSYKLSAGMNWRLSLTLTGPGRETNVAALFGSDTVNSIESGHS
jgi:hypothetical protein